MKTTRILCSLLLFTVAAVAMAAQQGKTPDVKIAEKVRELRLKQLELLDKQVKEAARRVTMGRDPIIVFLDAAKKRIEVALQVYPAGEERSRYLSQHLAFSEEHFRLVKLLVDSGTRLDQDAYQVEAAAYEARALALENGLPWAEIVKIGEEAPAKVKKMLEDSNKENRKEGFRP